MWKDYNNNPKGNRNGDCAVRAVSLALGVDWDSAFIRLCLIGFIQKDMPSSNAVIDELLRSEGFLRFGVPDTCPQCYTFADFCTDHQKGVFVLGTGTHCACVVDGVLMDAWDSRDEIPIYYYAKQ